MYGTNCPELQESIFLAEDLEDWHVKIKRANTKIDDFIWSDCDYDNQNLAQLVVSCFSTLKITWFLSQALLFLNERWIESWMAA